MAEIIESGGSGKKGGGRRQPKKHGATVDMTPMVDLICLLITFFMLTTAFSKPKVMEIVMPEKDNTEDIKDQPKIAADRTYNILISKNDQIYWYNGLIEADKPIPEIHKSDWSKDGIRKVLLEKNKKVFKQIQDLKDKVKTGELVISNDSLTAQIKELKKSDKKAPIILIKADENARYKNIVDIIDEMAICNIASYAIVDMSEQEMELIRNLNK